MSLERKVLIAGIGIGILSALLNTFYLPVENWDEARRGVNAILANCTRDYCHYRYLYGVLDTFNTKPPLFTLLLAGVFQITGISSVSLRIISSISFLLFLGYTFYVSKKHLSTQDAFLASIVLLTVHGIAGYHVAYNGDTDMLFVLFVTISSYNLYSYLLGRSKSSLVISASSLFLAFMTKGVAILLVAVGWIMYILFKWKEIQPIKIKELTISSFIVGALCVSLLSQFQVTDEGNLLYDVFMNDGIRRFTDSDFENGYKWDFIFVSLDTRFGFYIYVIYIGIMISLFCYRRMQKLNDFYIFNICMASSTILLLILSTNKHNWYIAPIIYPLSILVIYFFNNLKSHKVIITVAALLLLGITSVHRFDRALKYRVDKDRYSYVDCQINESSEVHISPYAEQKHVFFVYSRTCQVLSESEFKARNSTFKTCILSDGTLILISEPSDN